IKATDNNNNTDQRDFTLIVRDKQSRNDSIPTATPISNGGWMASISPYGDPADTANPDSDYYALTAAGGSYISVNVVAQRNNSPLQPVLEIVDQNGQRFHGCNQFGVTIDFNDVCMSDEIIPEQTLDAMLTFKVPGSGSQ